MNILGFTISRGGESEDTTIKEAPKGGYGQLDGEEILPDFKVKEMFKAYRTNEVVQAAVDTRAEAFAKSKLVLYRNISGEKREVKNHPILKLLKQPNPHWTRFGLMEMLGIHATLVGRAVWYYDQKANQIWPIIPDERFAPIADAKRFISGYKWKVNGSVASYAVEEIIDFHFKRDPEDFYKSSPATQSIGITYDTDQEARKWNWSFFRNHALPSFILWMKNPMQDANFKEFLSKFRQKFKGAKNAHKTLILNHEVGKADFSPTQKDMDFVAMSQETQKRMLLAFRTSRVLMGQGENVNVSNVEALTMIFNEFTLKTDLEKFVAVINSQLLPLFKDSVNLEMCYVDPNPESEDLTIRKRESESKIGGKTINELRDENGLEPVEGGDTILISAAMVPLNQAGLSQEEPEAEEVEATQSGEKAIKFKSLDRAVIEKAWIKRLDKREGRLLKIIRKSFENQLADLIKQLKKKKSIKSLSAVNIDVSDETKKMVSLVLPTFMEVVEREGKAAIVEVGLTDNFKVTDAMEKRIKKSTKNKIKDINQSTFEAVGKEVSAGVVAGESSALIATRLENKFSKFNGARAKTIARTETARHSSAARVDAYKQVDIKKHEWVTTADNRTRETHFAADGQIVDIEKGFSVGGENLKHPADPNGSAAETVNCRCVAIANTDE